MRTTFKIGVIVQAAIIALSSGLLGMILIILDPGSEVPTGERVTPSPMWHPPADWTGVP